MQQIISARGLSKKYQDFVALHNIDLDIGAGKIVGLIGPNGAGKTTALRCLLGLSTYEGDLSVMGKDPRTQRMELLNQVAYIADTAVLPKWITTRQILDYMQGVHPQFDRLKAEGFLAETEIGRDQKVREMSKGMITQLHLAAAISIDAKLLVLDEPTLGLDILYRRKFYQQLLEDFFDEERTVIITTHQVEEVEQLLTDIIFIRNGQLMLSLSMDEIAARYAQIDVGRNQLEEARRLLPISEHKSLAGATMLFEHRTHVDLEALGPLKVPSIADLFVALMGN